MIISLTDVVPAVAIRVYYIAKSEVRYLYYFLAEIICYAYTALKYIEFRIHISV